MATTKIIQATVKNRTDTAANWTQKNSVLAEGEIIVVQTSAGETRLKIGDGVKTFTQLPYTDEQIYNSVVTSVNGQTGDITMNPVEYTPQTLTDEQKKQARENIAGAGELFIITATTKTENGTIVYTIDKTFSEIKSAYKAGKMPVVSFGNYCYLAAATDTYFRFTGIGAGYDPNTFGTFFINETTVLFTRTNVVYTFTKDKAQLLPQQILSAAPTKDMNIATKKYVDDKISDKELVLSSSTAGSTKKFKLTIDDTGTLTASEITA